MTVARISPALIGPALECAAKECDGHRPPPQKSDRFANGFGNAFPHPRKPPAQQGFSGEDAKCDPDQTESDEMPTRERFMIKKNSEEKCAGRGEILQEPDRR